MKQPIFNKRYKDFDRKIAFDPFKKSRLWSSLWQLTNTLVLYFSFWYLMYQSLRVSYLLTIFLSVLAAGMLIRLFIIFHDCVHGSYLKTHSANNLLGNILSLFVFTPFGFWRRDHLSHHASVCNLDHKGRGDIWTLSLMDYQQSSPWQRFKYKFSRQPFAIFFTAPIFLRNRIPAKDCCTKDKISIYLTNLALVFVMIFLGSLIGFKIFLLIQVPILFIASAIGSWLFYVQHQFAGAKWARSENWDHTTAALEGTSFYDLPQILHWFTGNISFHHVHHLCPKIPNYNLQPCHKSYHALQQVARLSLRSSLQTLKNQLWDEEKNAFVQF